MSQITYYEGTIAKERISYIEYAFIHLCVMALTIKSANNEIDKPEYLNL